MSARADGSIIIDTRIRTDKASSQLLQLQNKIVKAADKINTLTQKMQQLKDTDIPTEEYKEIAIQIQNAEKEFDKLLAKQEQMQAVGKTSGVAWESMQYKMEEIGNTIRYAKGEMQDLIDSGQAFTKGADTSQYKKLSKDLEFANNDMRALCQRHKELEKKQDKNVKGYSRMGQVAGNTSKKAGTFLKGLSSMFGLLNKKVKISNGLFHTMGSRLKGIALSLLVFNWISKGWNTMISGMKEGIQNLAGYSSDFNQTMSDLKSSTEQAKNSLATAFAPVLSILVPYITSFVNVLNSACDAIARFFAFLGGKSTYIRAKKQNVDYAKSLDGIASSAKKALGALASFDELNVINQNEDSIDGNSGGSGGGDAFEEVPVGEISEWMKRLKEAIQAGDWYSVGSLIGQKLTESMNAIDWDTVYAGAAAFGIGLALFLNGLISPELFGALGRTIAGALNTALNFLNAFGETFDWSNFGKSLATGLHAFFENWDARLTARTFSNFGKGLLKSISSCIGTLRNEQTLKVIGQKLIDFIFGIDWAGLAWNLDTFFAELGAAISNFPIDFGLGIAEGIWKEISGQDITLEKPKWLENIAEIILGWIIPALGAINLGQKVRDAIWGSFENGGIDEIDMQPAIDKFNLFFEEIGTSATNFFDNLYANKLQEFVSNTSSKFSEWWNNSVKPWFTKEKWLTLGSNVKDAIISRWNETKEEWKTAISGWWNDNVAPWFTKEKWQELGTKMKEGICAGFKGAVNSIVDILNDIIGNAEGFINKISEGINTFLDGVNSSGVGEKLGLDLSVGTVSMGRLPHLANGAVIRGGSPFLAVLGDQPSGHTNIETPLSTMVEAFKQAYAEVGADMGGEYTFVAQLDGKTIFKEVVKRNQIYKKSTGVSAIR